MTSSGKAYKKEIMIKPQNIPIKVLDGCMGELLTDGGNIFSRYIITPLMNPRRINSIIVLKLDYSNVKVL